MKEAYEAYLWVLIVTFAILFNIGRVLLWIKGEKDRPDNRKKKLNIIGIAFFILLIVMFFHSDFDNFKNNNINKNVTYILAEFPKILIKVVLLVAVISFLLMLIYFIIKLVMKNITDIYNAFQNSEPPETTESSEPPKPLETTELTESPKPLETTELTEPSKPLETTELTEPPKPPETTKTPKTPEKKEQKSKKRKITKKIENLMKESTFIICITGGIFSIYLILPLLMGSSAFVSFFSRWENGLKNIVTALSKKNTDNFSENLSIYTLIFVLIVGIVYLIANIMFEILKEQFNGKKGILKEYSTSIGLMAIGISILLLMSSQKPGEEASLSEQIFYYMKPFILVVFVIASAILILEIVSLLIDMREKITRNQARYLFVLLVGMCMTIIMKAFLMVYNLFNNMLDGNDIQLDEAKDRIEKVCNRILQKVGKDMEKEINKAGNKDNEKIYKSFKQKITKK